MNFNEINEHQSAVVEEEEKKRWHWIDLAVQALRGGSKCWVTDRHSSDLVPYINFILHLIFS